ncbi:MAG TPA: glycine cleavage system aminomethyltransferase GcvT [Polyangia bacterium]|nr:glycine cleavage system aminomethyltransferase GcvT [Polyangia bacterium]
MPHRTPLYEAHLRLGAKMVDFGGWSMPVSYPGGILDEHHATRRAIGLFDVCHMGEIHFRGPRAAEAVQRLVTNDIGRLIDGRALYTVACLPDGGIIDDLIVYRLSDTHYLTVVNAATLDKDRAWFFEHARPLCEVTDASAETGLIAFQGPAAEAALQALTDAPLATLAPFSFVEGRDVAGVRASIARTGYTGEDGFELFCASKDAAALWDRLVEAAAKVGGKPAGLGARDTLRLEARLPLYGNDLDETTSPLEAGLGWVVKLEGADFIGRDALRAQKAAGVRRRLAGFVMAGRGIARHGYALYDAAGHESGTTTSGGPAPTLAQNVGLGYLPVELDQPGTRIQVDCRGKRVDAEIVKGPFYKRNREQKRGTA